MSMQPPPPGYPGGPPPGYPTPPPGYPGGPAPGYPTPPPGYPMAPMGGPSAINPVQLTIFHQDSYSRGLGCLGLPFLLLRLLICLPVAIWLVILLYVAELVAWIMQIVVVLTGHYPAGAHRFVTGVLRLLVRVYAFGFGLTDKYPGFSIQP